MKKQQDANIVTAHFEPIVLETVKIFDMKGGVVEAVFDVYN